MARPAIAWASSLNRTTVARAIAAAIATALRSVAAALANKYVKRNIDQSNGEKAFWISPTSFNITLMIEWFYPGRKPNNGTAVGHQLKPRLSPQANLLNVYHCTPSSTIISVGCKGVSITRSC